MPWIDPDDLNNRVRVRFAGEPYPRPRRGQDHRERERSVDPAMLAARSEQLVQSSPPDTDIEAMMVCPPGGNLVLSSEALAAEYPWRDAVQAAYTVARELLTEAQLEAWDVVEGDDRMSFREAGEKLGISHQGAHQRHQRARDRFATNLAWMLDPRSGIEKQPKQPAPPFSRWYHQLRRVAPLLGRLADSGEARWATARIFSEASDHGAPVDFLSRRCFVSPPLTSAFIDWYRNS